QMLRRREDYRRTLDRALALEREEGQDTFASWWMTDWQNAMTLAWAGDLDASREVLEAVYSAAVERGDEQALPYLLAWLGQIAFWKDEWSKGIEYAEAAYEASVSAP